MPARLIESLATTEPLANLFSDQSVLQAMLDFESALAKAEAGVGVIPQSAASAIRKVAKAENFDTATLAAATLRAGTPGIPLAKLLTEKVGAISSDAAGYVHRGATSQDVADTALILLLKHAEKILHNDVLRLTRSLKQLSQEHKHTVMLGRTLMQPAPPVTFGLKASEWFASIQQSKKNLDDAFSAALVLQFGGASGTLASFGKKGIEVARALASELKLACSEAPWHTQRERLATLMCACGVLTGALGKMARDISLLMQSEIAELAEPGGDGRGGSSTMPHKTNPIGCALTLSAAQRVPGLVASFLSGMVQEHERGVGGWQAEWPTVASIIQATGLAVASMAEVAEGLTINAPRMRSNIDATQGAIFAERASLVLGTKLGRNVAHKILQDAVKKSSKQKRRLSEVLAEIPDVTKHLSSATLRSLEIPEEYLGSTEAFRKALLSPKLKMKKKKEQ
ncbi:MAG TPA: 3-carboxy-cis,cis-muconate cycloisomerase [Terriglobales bacterium]|nr:3-carboxy-cis,cis-muconate cycloisomerase [Terriglobales bacterium]